MGISISYDTVLSLIALPFVLLFSVGWFILKSGINSKNNDEHDKECEEHVRLAERAAELLHEEEQLFKQPPAEDCPICFQRLPTLHTGYKYQTCCGKVVCSGCVYAPIYDNHGNEVDNKKCQFCRTSLPKSYEEASKRLNKLVEAGDPIAIYNLGMLYQEGIGGHPQDHEKALELYNRSGELGCAKAYVYIGCTYSNGRGVDVDKKKAKQYYGLAAMGGDVSARHNLGSMEARAGNMDRALKHFMIAARDGHADSLGVIKIIYSKGVATKDDYMKALRSYQAYLDEIKSDQRDKAAVFSDSYRYY